jgi:cell filamentation protein
MNNPADPYLYPGTSILINKLGLRDQSKLTQLEMTFSYVRLHELLENPQLGKFDYPHLQEIHHHIFKDIYDFAGVPRTIGMSKREAVIDGHSVAYPRPHDPFVPNNLAQRAKYAFDQLKKDNFLDW